MRYKRLEFKRYFLEKVNLGLNRITSQGINQLLWKNNLEFLDLSMIFSLVGVLAETGLRNLKVSSCILPCLYYLTNLVNITVFISRESDLEQLSRIILQNQSLERLVLVNDYSLGMYSLDQSTFNPQNFPHVNITIVSNEKGRFF